MRDNHDPARRKVTDFGQSRARDDDTICDSSDRLVPRCERARRRLRPAPRFVRSALPRSSSTGLFRRRGRGRPDPVPALRRGPRWLGRVGRRSQRAITLARGQAPRCMPAITRASFTSDTYVRLDADDLPSPDFDGVTGMTNSGDPAGIGHSPEPQPGGVACVNTCVTDRVRSGEIRSRRRSRKAAPGAGSRRRVRSAEMAGGTLDQVVKVRILAPQPHESPVHALGRLSASLVQATLLTAGRGLFAYLPARAGLTAGPG